MRQLEETQCNRPDLMKIARKVAHTHCPKCTGGEWQHGDRDRYHSKKCDELTADIYVQLSSVAR